MLFTEIQELKKQSLYNREILEVSHVSVFVTFSYPDFFSFRIMVYKDNQNVKKSCGMSYVKHQLENF